MSDRGMQAEQPGDGYPSRRVSIGLSRGGEMHVSIPGKPNEPIDERTLEALRAIGEAALNRMLAEDAPPDPERPAAIAACPEPFWHDTHRYCPSCPWTEDDE